MTRATIARMVGIGDIIDIGGVDMRRYGLTGIGSIMLTTAALASHGDARTAYGGAHHLGGHSVHFGGAMPGSGHHGHGLFGCRRCR